MWTEFPHSCNHFESKVLFYFKKISFFSALKKKKKRRESTLSNGCPLYNLRPNADATLGPE